MADTALGRIVIIPKGQYNSATAYTRLDAVQYQGSYYVVLRPCTGVTPTEGQDYTLMTSKGGTGNGIASVTLKSGDHTQGTSDVYTILFTDGDSVDFSVYNGANGGIQYADIVDDDTTGGAAVPASAEIVKTHGTRLDTAEQQISQLEAQQIQSTCVIYPRLGNGTINTFESGVFKERVKRRTLIADDIQGIDDRANIATAYTISLDDMKKAESEAIQGKIYTASNTEVAWFNKDNITNIGCFTTYPEDSRIYFILTKGTTLAAAKTALTGTIIDYELSTYNDIALPSTMSPNTQELVRLSQLVDKKANKQQMSWILPTLLNGYVAGSTAPSYLLDEMGFVHCKGRMVGVSGNIAFTLMEGCKPDSTLDMIATDSSGANILIGIDTYGNFTVWTTTTLAVSLDGISFKAAETE